MEDDEDDDAGVTEGAVGRGAAVEVGGLAGEIASSFTGLLTGSSGGFSFSICDNIQTNVI